jgi:hypothetical protein
MQTRIHALARIGLVVGALMTSMTLASPAAAHSHIEVGDYHITVGWINEPTFAGQPNGIEIFIDDHDEKPVVDLGADALKLVVSTGGKDSATLALTPAFSVEEGFGTPGTYTADVTPTVPGEYTLHITGSIHTETVDVSVTSGEETFSSVASASDIEFPVKNPSLVDVATRLERIDGRIVELQNTVPSAATLAGLQSAAADAKAAADAASQTAMLGVGVGIAGLVVAVGAVWFALRAGRRSTLTA